MNLKLQQWKAGGSFEKSLPLHLISLHTHISWLYNLSFNSSKYSHYQKDPRKTPTNDPILDLHMRWTMCLLSVNWLCWIMPCHLVAILVIYQTNWILNKELKHCLTKSQNVVPYIITHSARLGFSQTESNMTGPLGAFGFGTTNSPKNVLFEDVKFK